MRSPNLAENCINGAVSALPLGDLSGFRERVGGDQRADQHPEQEVAQLLASQVAPGFVGALALVYLGSIAIIDGIGANDAGEAREIGQSWLSAFWTVTGLAAVVWGLVRKSANARLAGLALLTVAIAKVWTYDLAKLDELPRALSFVALGLLLVGAFAYQRIKPSDGNRPRNGERGRKAQTDSLPAA